MSFSFSFSFPLSLLSWRDSSGLPAPLGCCGGCCGCPCGGGGGGRPSGFGGCAWGVPFAAPRACLLWGRVPAMRMAAEAAGVPPVSAVALGASLAAPRACLLWGRVPAMRMAAEAAARLAAQSACLLLPRGPAPGAAAWVRLAASRVGRLSQPGPAATVTPLRREPRTEQAFPPSTRGPAEVAAPLCSSAIEAYLPPQPVRALFPRATIPRRRVLRLSATAFRQRHGLDRRGAWRGWADNLQVALGHRLGRSKRVNLIGFERLTRLRSEHLRLRRERRRRRRRSCLGDSVPGQHRAAGLATATERLPRRRPR